MIKEIQTGYLSSSYLKDIYLYLAQNEMPISKVAIRKVRGISRIVYIIRLIIIQINIYPDKETAVLEIPETCADKTITLYH